MLVFEIKLYFFSSLNASPFSLFIILLSWESNVLENKFLLGLTFCIKNVNTSKVWFWTLRFLSLLLICSKYEHVNINMNMNKLWNKEISTAVTTSKSFSWLLKKNTVEKRFFQTDAAFYSRIIQYLVFCVERLILIILSWFSW